MSPHDSTQLINFEAVNYDTFCNRLYKQGVANNWTAGSIQLSTDQTQYHSIITVDQKKQFDNCIGFFIRSERLVTHNILDALGSCIPIHSVKQYLARQVFEEANHEEMFEYVIREMDMDRGRILNLRNEFPSIAAKQDFEAEYTAKLIQAKEIYSQNPSDATAKLFFTALIQNLVAYYAVLESLFFFTNFIVLINFQKQNLFIKVGDLIKYQMRDEAGHISFGLELIRTLIRDNQHLMSDELNTSIVNIISRGVELEEAYTLEAIGDTNITKSSTFIDYVRSIADKRLVSLGFEKRFGGGASAMKHLINQNDAPEMVNFFETDNVAYQKA